MAENITYKDFDFNFEMDENGELGVLTNEDSIKQSIKNVILTNILEKVRYQNPKFGSRIRKLLGEKINGLTALQIGDEIEIALLNWEKRVDIIEITAEPNISRQSFDVLIKYKIKNLNTEDSILINLGIIK